MIKQRTESIEVYKKNNRDDLLQIEMQEQEILSSYLPKQMSEEETKKICSEVVGSTKVVTSLVYACYEQGLNDIQFFVYQMGDNGLS